MRLSSPRINEVVARCRKGEETNVLFLLPPNIELSDFLSPPENYSRIKIRDREFGSVITDIPLGVTSLSGYLKKHFSVDVRAVDFNVVLNCLIDAPADSFEEIFSNAILEKTVGWRPDIIGVSAMFSSAYEGSLDLLRISRQLFNDALIMAGGNLITAMWKEYLDDSPYLDLVCYGEGELPLYELLSSEIATDYLSNSTSWITHDTASKAKDRLKHNFVNDLDELPPVDYDILDLPGYSKNPTVSRFSVPTQSRMDSNERVEALIENSEKLLESIPPIPIMTSRGCPFKCTFCASHAAHGRDMRYFSVQRVRTDLQRLVTKYGCSHVVVQDDHFMGGKRRPYEVVGAMKDLNIGMFFQNALAMYALDREFLRLLKSSNVDELVLPIESGSMRVLRDLMRKPLKTSIIARVVKDCRQIGIYTDANIIVGMPGETRQDIEESRAFLKTVFADWFRIYVATPLPGSEMHQLAIDLDAYVLPPYRAHYKRAVIKTQDLSPDDIEFYTYLMNLELNFVFNSNLRLGLYDVAIKGFELVLSVKNDHPFAYLGIGIAQASMSKFDQANIHFDKAVEIFFASYSYWAPFLDELKIDIENFNAEKFMSWLRGRWALVPSESEEIIESVEVG